MTSHATTESFRVRVQAFYQHYCPEKATSTHIDFIMDKYRGHEAEVISVLSEKYGPEPQPQSQPMQLSTSHSTGRTFDQRPGDPDHYDQPRSAVGLQPSCQPPPQNQPRSAANAGGLQPSCQPPPQNQPRSAANAGGLQPSSQPPPQNQPRSVAIAGGLQPSSQPPPQHQRAHSPPGAAHPSNRMEELGLSSPGTFGQFDGGSPPIIVKSRSADGAAATFSSQPMSRLDLIEAMARADAAKPRPPPPPPPVVAARSAVSTSQSHHLASVPAPQVLAPAPVTTAPTPSRQTGHYSGLNTSSYLSSATTPHQTAASRLPQPMTSMPGGGLESGLSATNTQQASDFARSSVLGGTAQISATSAVLANALSQNQTPHHGQHQFPRPLSHPHHSTAAGAGNLPSAGVGFPNMSGGGGGGTVTSTTSEALAEALAVRQQQFARDLDHDTQREMDAHHDTLEAAKVEKAQEIQRQELAIHELRNALKITTRQAKLEDDEARASAARTARELTRAKVSMMVLENQHLRLDSASPLSGLISKSNGGLLPSGSDGGGRVNINGTPMRTMPRDAPSDSSMTMLPSSSAHGAGGFAGSTDLTTNPNHSRRRDLDLGGSGGAMIRVPSASLTARNTSLIVGGSNSNAAAVAGRIVAHGHAAAKSSNSSNGLSGGGALNQSLFDHTTEIDRNTTDTKENESKTPVTAHAFDRTVESALNAARDRAEVESRRHQLASVIRHHLTLHPLSAVFQTLTASNAFLAGELENIALRAPYAVSDELTQLAAARARERNGTNRTSEETADAHLEDLRGTRVPKPEDPAAEAVKRLLQDPHYGSVPSRPTSVAAAPRNDASSSTVLEATPEVRKFGRTIPTESHSTTQDPTLLRTPEEIHRTQHVPSQQTSSQNAPSRPPDALPTGLSAGLTAGLVGAGGNANGTETEEGLAFRDLLSHAPASAAGPAPVHTSSQAVPRAPMPEDLPEGLRRGPLPFAVTKAGPVGNDNGVENDDGQTPLRREVDIDGRTPIRLDII